MDPLTNIQVAVKNNIDVFYFSCLVPMHVLFVEGGQMGRSFVLGFWSNGSILWEMLCLDESVLLDGRVRPVVLK